MFTRNGRRSLLAAAAMTGAAALALTGCSSAGSEASGYDPDEEVTLNFTWWGNEDRAERYQQLIASFEEEHPNITIDGTFTDFPSYWEKRKTEAAGGGLPDVWQFSDSYLREYAEPGLLLDLDTVSEYIDFDAFDCARPGSSRARSTRCRPATARGPCSSTTHCSPTPASSPTRAAPPTRSTPSGWRR
jgi:multiple sugar transport system substrate-binding protein